MLERAVLIIHVGFETFRLHDIHVALPYISISSISVKYMHRQLIKRHRTQVPFVPYRSLVNITLASIRNKYLSLILFHPTPSILDISSPPTILPFST